MKRLFSLLIIFLSFQSFAQRYTADNGMIDIKLVAIDDAVKGNMSFVLFKIELEGEEISYANSKERFDTYFTVCPQKLENKTLVITAFRADCDSIRRELIFDTMHDTVLYFRLIKDFENPKTSKELMMYKDIFQRFHLTSSPTRMLEDDAIMMYEHCDGRIAQYDSIPEAEMLSGAWGDLMIPQQIIARCSNKQCEWGDSVQYINCIGDTIIPYGTLQYMGDDIILDYGVVYKRGSTGSSKMIGINAKGEELFEVYMFDNGPDYMVE
jgi:hypothetical protein